MHPCLDEDLRPGERGSLLADRLSGLPKSLLVSMLEELLLAEPPGTRRRPAPPSCPSPAQLLQAWCLDAEQDDGGGDGGVDGGAGEEVEHGSGRQTPPQQLLLPPPPQLTPHRSQSHLPPPLTPQQSNPGGRFGGGVEGGGEVGRDAVVEEEASGLEPPDGANDARPDGLPGTLGGAETRDLGQLMHRLRFYLKDRIISRGSTLSEASFRLRSLEPEYLVSLVGRARRVLGLRGHRRLRFQLFFGFILREGQGEGATYSFRYPSNNTSLRRRLFTFFPGAPLEELYRCLREKGVEERLSEYVAEASKLHIESVCSVLIRFLHTRRQDQAGPSFTRGGAAVYLRELPCAPYSLSFYCCLTAALHDLALLPDYQPLSFASSFLNSIPYINEANRSLFHVHPFRNEALFGEIARLFSVSLVLLCCDSRGQRRALLDMYGTSEEALRNQVVLVFVTDQAAFHETVARGDVVEAEERWESELLPRGQRVLSRESKAVLSAVEASLAATRLRRQEGQPLPTPPTPPMDPGAARSPGRLTSDDEEEEEEDPGMNPFRPPVTTFPMPARLDRWIHCTDVEAFLSTFHCRKQCGSWFNQRSDCRRHEEETCVRNEEADEDGRFLSLRYSQTMLRPKVRLLDRLITLGYRLSPEQTSPRGLAAADLETLQSLVDPRLGQDGAEELGAESHQRRFTHSVFTIGWSCALEGRDGPVEDDVLVGPRFPSAYAMVEGFVERMRALALRHRELELERAAPLLDSMRRDLGASEADNPDGPTVKSLRKVIHALESRLSTFTVGWWNGSSFDIRVLISSGMYAAMKLHFEDVRILKRGSRYLSIVAKSHKDSITVRFVDYMLLSVRCSLSSYLESHSGLLASLRASTESEVGGGEEAVEDGEADLKGCVPYHALGKAVTEDGQDSGYQWCLEDWLSPLDGLNALGRERRRFEAALGEMEGDEERALRVIGASAPPPTAEQLFRQLQRSWHRRGLDTAFATLIDYQVRDTRPLLQISLHSQAVCMAETGLSVFLDASTVSSFAWSNLMSRSLRGPDRLLLYPLKPWLMREMRAQLVGGPSFTVQRLVEKGQPIPVQNLLSADQPPDPVRLQAAETVACSKSLDANGLYAHCMGSVLHGLPVYRHRTDGYVGQVDDSANATFAAQWLAFVEESGAYGAERVQSLYSGNEAFVTINRTQYAAEIQIIYDETIGSYLESRRVAGIAEEVGQEEEEQEDWQRFFQQHDARQRRDQEDYQRLVEQESSPQRPADTSTSPRREEDEDEEGAWSSSSSLSGFIVSDDDDDDDDDHDDENKAQPQQHSESSDKVSAPRRRIDSSSSSCSSGSTTPTSSSSSSRKASGQSPGQLASTQPAPSRPHILHPYAEASSLLSLRLVEKNRREMDSHRRLDNQPVLTQEEEEGENNFSARRRLNFADRSNVDDDERRDIEPEPRSQAREKEKRQRPATQREGQERRRRRRERDGEGLRRRFSPSGTGLMRWRVDGLVREPDEVKLVLEAMVCGAGHGPCNCPDCPYALEPGLVERRRFADGRTVGRMRADDAFRRRLLQLVGYRVVEKYRCDWEAEVAVEGSAEADFVRSHSLHQSPHRLPLRQRFSEPQLLQAILDGRTHGLIKCALTIPHHQRPRLAPLAPIFVNVEVDWKVTRGPMRNYLRWLGSHDAPVKTLLSVFEVQDYLTTSRLVSFLVEHFEAVVFDIEYFVELQLSHKLQEYTSAMTSKRRQADEESNEVLASYAKLSVNSCYGTSLFRAERNTTTRLVDEAGWERAFSKGTLSEAAFVGPPSDRQSLVELTTLPRRITVKSPILIGFNILTEAKMNLLLVFDFLSKMLRPTAWCLNGGDTDSLNISLSHCEMRECVREECMEEFDRIYPTLFADPSRPETKRQLGLWKVEFESEDLCYVSPKLYLMRRADGSGKMASRGVSRADNYLSWQTYKDAVFRPRRFQQLLEHFGVRVTGRGRLAWTSAGTVPSSASQPPTGSVGREEEKEDEMDDVSLSEDSEGRTDGDQPLSQETLFTYSPPRTGTVAGLKRSRSAPHSLPNQGPRPTRTPKDPRLENIAGKLWAWTQGQVLEEEEELGGGVGGSLFVHNFSIQPLPTARHTVASQMVRKRIFGGQFLKRQVCDDMTSTVPIPHTLLQPYLKKRMKKCNS